MKEEAKQNKPMQRPIGLVLCGGDSSRMQRDKALIRYHDLPQWEYIYNLLTPFCESVYLSLNTQQAESWQLPDSVSIVEDIEAYSNHGPMSGLLSVLSKVDNRPVFVVACDYPLLRKENLQDLMERRSMDKQVVCYQNDNWPEPLIAIFEIASFPNLLHYFDGGHDSMAKFIRKANTVYIDVSNPEFLQNANDPEALALIQNRLKNDKGNYDSPE